MVYIGYTRASTYWHDLKPDVDVREITDDIDTLSCECYYVAHKSLSKEECRALAVTWETDGHIVYINTQDDYYESIDSF